MILMFTAIYRQEWRSYNSRFPAAKLDMWLSISLSMSVSLFPSGRLAGSTVVFRN